MKKLRRISPLLALCFFAFMAWAAQSHVSNLQLFKHPNATATTKGNVTAVTVPLVKEGESAANLRARVELHYEANGKAYGRVLMQDMAQHTPPKQGDTIPLTYLIDAPEHALLPYEIANLDSQISGMQFVLIALGVLTLLSPFMLIRFSRR